MKTFELMHVYETDPETFWKVFFDEDYNKALYTKAIKVIERKVLELSDDEHAIVRKVQISPDEEIPTAFQKVIGGDTTYIETMHWSRGSNEASIDVKLTAKRLAPKVHFKAKVIVSPHPRGIRRVISGELKVDIMLLGGQIEKAILKSIKKEDDISEPFMAQWLRNL